MHPINPQFTTLCVKCISYAVLLDDENWNVDDYLCPYVFKKNNVERWWLCESEIDILLCESSVALYVWNVFPMQFFLRMKIEMSMATYATMCFKK